MAKPTPPFNRPVDSFITPDVRDKLVWTDHDSRNGNYVPLAPGTPHPDQTKYPGYVLVHQAPRFEDDTTVRRWYAAEREEQWEYNFEIAYPYGDEAYPRYTRTYVIPREDYAPLEPLTVDPVNAQLKLVEQAQGRAGEREIDNVFLIVKRIYERVPGVPIVSEGYNAQGELETKTQQLVVAGTDPTADGLLVNQSAVEANNTITGISNLVTVVSRPVLTSEVIDERGDKATITEQVVAPGTDPDNLSVTVKDSTVVAETPTKSRKKTATSTPSTLTTKRVNERGDVETETDDIVAQGTAPDADGLLVTKTEVADEKKGRSRKRKATVAAHATLTTAAIGDPDLTPPKFRGRVTRTVTEDIVAPGTSPSTPGGGLLASEVKQVTRTKSVKTNTSETLDIQGPLVGEEAYPGGTSLATSESLVAEGTEAAHGFLVADSQVSPLGDGNAVKVTRTAQRKSDGDYEAGWPLQLAKKQDARDLIPAKFRGKVAQVTETEQKVLSDPDVLPDPVATVGTGGVLAASTKKVNDERFEETTVTQAIDLSSGPFVGQQAFPGGIVINTSEALGTEGDGADKDFLTVQSTSTPLGDGNAVIETQSAVKKEDGDYVPGWPVQYVKERDAQDLIPSKFRALVSRDTQVEQKELTDPDALPAPVGVPGVSGVIAAKTEKANDERYTETTVTLDVDTTSTLTGDQVNAGSLGDNQTVTEAVVTDGTAADEGFNIISSSVDPLGNGFSIKQTVSQPSFPALTAKKRSKADLTPPKFRASTLETTAISKVAPATNPDTITGDVVESQIVPETKDRSEKRTTSQVITEGSGVPSSRVNARGDVETVAEALVDDTEVAADSILTTESSVEGLGNGKAVQTTATVEAHSTLTSELRNERGDKVVETDDIVTPGTDPTALSVTVEDSQVVALTATKSRRKTRTSEAPSTLTSNRVNERGDVETVLDNIVAAGTSPDADGLLVTESKVEALNRGRSRKIKASVAAHSTLISEVRNERGDLVTQTDDIVAAGTDPTALSVTVEDSRVEALSATKSRKVTRTSETPSVLTGEEINERGDKVTITDALVSPGTDPDAVSVTVESSAVKPVNKGKSRKVTVTSAAPSTLTTKRVNERGDTETVTDDIVTPATSPDADGLLVTQSVVEAINAGRSRKRKAVVDAHSDLATTSKGSPLLIPEKFRALVTRTQTESIVDPATPPSSITGDLRASEVKAVSATKALKTDTEEVVDLGVALVGEEAFPGGISVTTSEEIVVEGTAAERSSIIIDSSVEPLGDGNAIKRKRIAQKKALNEEEEYEYVDGFPKKYSKTKDGQDLIPPKFRALAVQATTVESKDLEDPDTLPDPVAVIGVADVISAKTDKVNDERFEETTVTLEVTEGASVPSSRLTERGDIETVSQSIVDDTVPAADGFLVSSSSVEGLGNGKAIETVGEVESYATLTSEIRNERGDKVTETDDIVAPGTDPTALSTTVEDSRVEALSATKSRRRTRTSETPSVLTGEEINERGDKVTITDALVAPGTDPDAVSTTVESSAVKPVNKGKSRKVTTTSESPSTLTSERYNERGDVETVTDDIVDPGTDPDADGLLVTESIVEAINKGRSRKRKAMVESHSTLTTSSNNPGLLGVTSTTDDIVAAGTSSTALSTTVVSSEVQALSATKSRKRTTTASGPTSLAGKRVNARGDTETVTESIVAAGASPDADSILQISSQVEPIDAAKSKKTTIAVAANTALTSEIRNTRGDKVAVVNSVVAPGTDPDALSTTVEDSKVQAVSATKSEKTTATSDTPSALTSEVIGERGDKVTIVNTIVSPGTDPDDLSPTIEASEVRAVNNGKSEKTTRTSATPTTLTTVSRNARGDLETATDDIVAEGTSPDADGLLVTETSVALVQKGRARKVKKVVDAHTTLTTTSIGSPSLTPAKYRKFVERTETEAIVAPATAPSTITGDLRESTVKQLTKTKAAKTDVTETIDTSASPLFGQESFPGGVAAKTSEALVDEGTDALRTFGTIDSSVTPLGDGTAIRSGRVAQKKEFNEDTDEYEYVNGWPTQLAKELAVSDVIPAKFRGLATTSTVIEQKPLTDPEAVPDPIAVPGVAGVLAASTEKVNDERFKETTVSLDIAGGSALGGSQVTPSSQGDVQTVSEFLTNDAESADSGFNIISSEVEAIGAGLAIKRTVTQPDFSTLEQQKRGKADLTPAKFRASTLEIVTIDKVGAGTSPDAITGDVVESVVVPETNTRSEKRTTEQTIVDGDSIPSSRINARGDIETVTETLVDDTEVAAGDILVTESSIEGFGNGKAAKRIAEVESHAVLSSEVLNERGDKVTVASSIVVPGTDPDAASTTVEDSRVQAQDSFRSEKVTRTSVTPTDLTSEILNNRGDKISVVNSIVAPGTDPDAASVTVEDSQVRAINKGRSEKTTTTSVTPSTLTSKRINEMGIVETVTDNIVAPSTAPAGGYLVTGDEVAALNKGRSKQVRQVVASWPTMTDYEWDDDLKLFVTVTREMIDITLGNDEPSISAGQDITQRELNIYRALRTTRSVDTGDLPSFDTQEWIEFAFPSLLLGLEVDVLQSTDGTLSKIQTFYNIRRGWSALVSAHIVVDYLTSAPSPSSIFQIKPVELRFNGFFFDVNTPAVLTNGGYVTGTNGTADPVFPYSTETYTYGASSPTESAYSTLIGGSEQLVSEEIRPFRYNLWRRRRVYVVMQ